MNASNALILLPLKKNRFEIHVVFYKQSGVTNQFPSNDSNEDWVIAVHHLLALSR